MSRTYEVKHWSNGVRTIEVYEKASQADKRAAELNSNKYRYHGPNPLGPAVVVDCCSTHDIIKEFREIRKRPKPQATPPAEAAKGRGEEAV